MTTNTNGIAAEERVSAELLERGYTVSKPVIHAPYDLVVDIDSELIKVQVKRGFPDKQREGRIRVSMEGTNGRKYTEDQVDVFAVYDPVYDRVYWIDFEDAPKNEIRNKPENLNEDNIDKKL